MDWDREARTGVAEAVLCSGKSVAQIEGIVSLAREEGRRLLLTRMDATHWDSFDRTVRTSLDYDERSRTAILGALQPRIASGIGIVAAGTSDMPVALEASRTLAFAAS